MSRKRRPRKRRKSPQPEARAAAEAKATPQDVPLALRRGPFLAGIVLAVLAVFFAPASVRELCIVVNHGDFVRDELEVEYLSMYAESMAGNVVSTGERFCPQPARFGLDRLRQLDREGKLEGYRLPVGYLPKQGIWWWVDCVNAFRLLSQEEFEAPFGYHFRIIAINVVLAGGSVVLIRRGLRGKPATAAGKIAPDHVAIRYQD